MGGDVFAPVHSEGTLQLVPSILLVWSAMALFEDQCVIVVCVVLTSCHHTSAEHSNCMAAEKHCSNKWSATYHFERVIVGLSLIHI